MSVDISNDENTTMFPDPNDIPPPSEDQLTEEDLFRMRSLTINSQKGLGGVSETAEQSILSLADSTSNFDEHVGMDMDSELGEEKQDNDENELVQNGWFFGRVRNENFSLNTNTVTVLTWPKHIAVPPCPTGIDSEDWERSFLGSKIYLVGTAHFSEESQNDVTETIKNIQPDYVMMELCPSRISIILMDENTLLKESKSLTTQKIMQTIKQNGVIQGVLQVLLLSMVAHITQQLSMAPGGEFRAAHKAATAIQLCRIVLGDRPIQITLKRAWSSLSIWQKIKLAVHVLFSNRNSITKEDVEKCKQKDLLEQLLSEMADDFPQLCKIFVEERDAYMVHVLHSLLLRNAMEKRMTYEKMNTKKPYQPLSVVAIVGIGHTPGILSKWDEEVDFPSLVVVPPPKKSSQIIKIGFNVVIWGSLGYLLYRGGSRVARRFL